MLVVTVHFTTKPEAVDAFREAILYQAKTSREQEQGCLQFDVCHNPNDTTQFLVYEIYADEEAFEVHSNSAHSKLTRERVGNLLVGRELQIWDHITNQPLTSIKQEMKSPESMDLPPYTYVPKQTPHPVSDAEGHSHGGMELPKSWCFDQTIAWGYRLFQNGFYWEAHEAWEACWHDERENPAGDRIKAFIKTAAAYVKCLEGNRRGAISHAQRAKQLFIQTEQSVPAGTFPGEMVDAIWKMAEQIEHNPPVCDPPSDGTPRDLSAG